MKCFAITGKLVPPFRRKASRKTLPSFNVWGAGTRSIGNLYCSQVCCAYALRLIKAIRHQYPEVEATFLYMDIQPAGASFQQFLDSCRQDKGIRLIRSLPSKIYHAPRTDDLRVRLTDPQKDEVVEETFDLIVLSVGMVLRKESKTLLEFFGLGLTEDGFIAPPSPRTGIFVTGACSGPKDIDRSILQAKSTAFQVHQYLRGRELNGSHRSVHRRLPGIGFLPLSGKRSSPCVKEYPGSGLLHGRRGAHLSRRTRENGETPRSGRDRSTGHHWRKPQTLRILFPQMGSSHSPQSLSRCRGQCRGAGSLVRWRMKARLLKGPKQPSLKPCVWSPPPGPLRPNPFL